MALVVEQNIDDLAVLAVDGVALERLHHHILAIGVLLARNLELLFLGGKLLDDLVHGDAGRLRGVEVPFAAVIGQCRSHRHNVSSNSEKVRKCDGPG